MTTSRSARVREALGYPVVDIDGHILEFMPALNDFLRDEMGPAAFDRFARSSQWASRSAGSPDLEEMVARRRPRNTWWGFPARNTLDRATAMLPSLLYERLDELGIDYTVLYPTICLGACAIDEAELRRAACRGYNRFCAEIYGPFADRMTAAGVIPMDDPAEAIAELEHCSSLGLKVVGIPHGVLRRVEQLPADTLSFYRVAPRSVWFDSFGLDSADDYDPVWQRFVDLGYPVTSHAGITFYSNTYTSPTNYSHNHIGSHAEAMATLCKSLYFGGVTRRFPKLSVGFLECGVVWASALLSALEEHWEKRNLEAMADRDPAAVDRALLASLFRKYAGRLLQGRESSLDELLEASLRYTDNPPPATERDDWRHLGVATEHDLGSLFVEPFFFGCEGDDRTVAFAFSRANAFGATLQACFSSDVGHWDVDTMNEVVADAHRLLERGLLTDHQLRAFLFENPARLYTRANPNFFRGTPVEAYTEPSHGGLQPAKGAKGKEARA